MAFSAGNAFVTVSPRFTGFQGIVTRQMGSIMPSAGRSAGNAFGKGVSKGAAAGIDSELPGLKRAAEAAGKTVQAATEKTVKARDTAADAAGKLRVAEEKLNQVRSSGKATPDQLAAAEERVASAQRKVEQTSRAAESAQKTYVEAMKTSSAAHETLQKAAEESEKATKDAGKSSSEAAKTYASGWRGVGQRVKGFVSGGVKSAVASAKTQAEQGGRQAGSGFSTAFKGAIGAVAVGFSATAVAGFIKDSVDLAGSAEQSVGAIDTVFKENSAVMHQWAADAKKTVGISANEYRELGTLLGSQLKNMGTPMGELADKTNGLIGMGADMASMFGGTTKEAIEAISSALKGEMDPIERYGVTLSAAALEAEALSKGILKPVVDADKVATAATKMTLAQNKYNEVVKKNGKDSDEAKRAKLALTSAEEAYSKATAGKVPKLDAESKALAIQSALYGQSADAQGNFMREEDTFEHKRQVALASWADLKTTLGTAFLPAMTTTFGFIGDTAIPALQSFGSWVQQNQTWLKPLAVTLLGMGGTMLAFRAVIPIITGITTAVNLFKGGFAALNLVMKANVFGIIISAIAGLVAGFMYLWNTNEGFRNFFIGIWKGISSFFVGIWTGYLQPAMKALADFWTKTLAPALSNAWRNVIKPVFSALGSFFKTIWDSILYPLFTLFRAIWVNVLAPALKQVWENKIKPVFSALGSFFKWVWESVLKPAFDSLVGFWRDTLAPILKNVWNNVIKPVFETLGNFVRDKVAPAFQKGIDAVKNIWDTLKNIAKAPVKFMVETVINKGLIGGFNTLVGWIPGVEKMKPLSLPEGFYDGGWTGPGHKYQEAGIVHADEFVVKKSSRRRIERRAPGFLDSLNRLGDKALGYANGGLVRPLRGGRVSSGFGASRGRYPHAGQDFATPVGTPIFAAMDGTVLKAGWNAITGRTGIGAFLGHAGGRNTYYGHLSRLLVQVGDAVKQGQQIALSGNTGRSTGPHLHFETWTGGKPVNPAAYLNGAELPEGGNGDGGGWNPIQALLDVGGKIKGWFDESFPTGGKFVDAAFGLGTKMFTDMKDWAWSKIQGIGDFAKDTWSNVKGFFTGGKSKSKEAVRAVANNYGWGGGDQWDALQSIVQKESGWDLNAANPNSAARGLFQKMTSLHGPIEATAEGQAQWGLNYIKQRYGNPMNAWAFWQKNHSYADGGHVAPTLYDQGGILPTGVTSILNATRKPEAILNPSQWASVMKSIEVSHRVADGRGFEGIRIDRVELPPRATVDDLVGALKFEKRVSARGGVR